MKRLKGVWSFWDCLLTLGFALFVYGWAWEKGALMKSILGGIPYMEGDTIELLLLGKWLFLFGFFFFILCRRLYTDSKIGLLEQYRYGSFRKWWSMRFLNLHLRNTLAFLTAYLLWAFLGGLKSGAAEAAVFYLHLSAMVSVLITADFLSQSKAAPCVLLAAEGIACVLSVRHRLSWLACGMYSRSCFARADGFPVWLLVAEAALTGLCWVMVLVLYRKGISER